MNVFAGKAVIAELRGTGTGQYFLDDWLANDCKRV